VRATLAFAFLTVAATAAADPAHVAGVIVAGPGIHIPRGATVFVIVKAADVHGDPTGLPLAEKRMTWPGRAISFRLDDRDAMLASTKLAGDVVVTARFDQDGDAISKQAGDVEGRARVTVPADNVPIVLDQIRR
jgi:hypothetical protein